MSWLKRWILHSPFRVLAMLFLIGGLIKFVVYREWSYAVFMAAFVALGVYFSVRDMRREREREEEKAAAAADPSAPIHPE